MVLTHPLLMSNVESNYNGFHVIIIIIIAKQVHICCYIAHIMQYTLMKIFYAFHKINSLKTKQYILRKDIQQKQVPVSKISSTRLIQLTLKTDDAQKKMIPYAKAQQVCGNLITF